LGQRSRFSNFLKKEEWGQGLEKGLWLISFLGNNNKEEGAFEGRSYWFPQFFTLVGHIFGSQRGTRNKVFPKIFGPD